MNKLLAAVAAFAFVAFVSVNASATTPAATPTFSGAYVGADVGVGNTAPVNADKNNLALAYDGVAGYDIALGNTGWVTGLVGSFGKKDTQNYTYTGGLRLGHTLVGPNTLGYAKVAYANTNLDANGGSGSFGGVQAGLGLETFVTQKVSVGAEGDYTAYRSGTINGLSVDPSDIQLKAKVAYHF